MGYIYINEYYVYRYRVIGYILCSKIQLKFNLCIKKMKIYMRWSFSVLFENR